MGPLGFREIAVIILIIVILFGAKRIPELARSIGTGFREFKKGIQGVDDESANDKKGDRIEGERGNSDRT